MKILSRIAFAGVLAAVTAAPVSADPYRVKGLAVDAQGVSNTDATQAGRAQARLMGAQRLIERLTLPEDRQSASQPIEASDIARLTNSFDIEVDEKRSATASGARYTATLIYNFDAKPIREYLTARAVPFVDNQAGKVLLVPAVAQGVTAAQWGALWSTSAAGQGPLRAVTKSDDTLLTPYIASAQTFDRHPSWSDVAAETQRIGASSAVVAEVYNQSGYYVRLSDLRGGAQETTIGTVGPFSDLATAQNAALVEMERAWKRASVVRTSGATSMAITAAFRSLADWVRIKKGLETSRLVSGLQIESISATGADLSFTFAGRPDQLAADLRSRGLDLRGADNGWTIEAASLQ